jgi:hypothetical protein
MTILVAKVLSRVTTFGVALSKSLKRIRASPVARVATIGTTELRLRVGRLSYLFID